MSSPVNVNKVLQGSVATQRATIPGIPSPNTGDRNTDVILNALKERSEVREGQRGNPFEKAITAREMDELGLIRTTPAPCRVTELAGIIGQTKAGEFVLVSIEDLAAAIKLKIG